MLTELYIEAPLAQKSQAERLLSPIAVIQNSKSHQFEGQLSARSGHWSRFDLIEDVRTEPPR